MKTYAIVLAGGSGQRMQSATEKQLLKLSGKSILEHTLAVFCFSEKVDAIVIVCPDVNRMDYIKAANFARQYKASVSLVAGGVNRNSSTFNGVMSIKDLEAKILIHDSVRPLLTTNAVERCVDSLDVFDAVDTIIPSADTLVQVEDSRIVNIPDRSKFFRGQTPQSFKLSVLREALEAWSLDGRPEFTDDCAIVLRYLPKIEVHCIPGEVSNIKITEPLDLFIAEKLFQLRTFELPVAAQSKSVPTLDTVAIIFGGETGIGLEIARVLGRNGYQVVSLSRSTGGPDVKNFAEVQDSITRASQLGKISLVVNCAASLSLGNISTLKPSEIAEDINVNLVGAINIAKASFPHLSQTKGQLIMFGSSSAARGRSGFAAYSSSKAGVVNLTQALAEEWHSHGVKVNCVNPERTRTPLRSKAFGSEDPAELLDPSKVATVVLNITKQDFTGMVIDVKMSDYLI
jgi:2-C-methyl-D-erythritol 4-phosphate cytidylyltransferase